VYLKRLRLTTKLIILLCLVVSSLSLYNINVNAQGSSLAVSPKPSGVVDLAAGDNFTISVTFRNIGSSASLWSISVSYECESWIWNGTQQRLSLGIDENQTLTWNGRVPVDAAEYSYARLIISINNSSEFSDSWIHILSSQSNKGPIGFREMVFTVQHENESSSDTTQPIFVPSDLVKLTANVTFNNISMVNANVAFEVVGSAFAEHPFSVSRTQLTNSKGIAEVTFKVPPYTNITSNDVVGKWAAYATVVCAGEPLAENLTFNVTQPPATVQIKSIEILNKSGNRTQFFHANDRVTVILTLNHTGMPLNASSIIDISDSLKNLIGQQEINSTLISDGTVQITGAFDIPQRASVGNAVVTVTIYNTDALGDLVPLDQGVAFFSILNSPGLAPVTLSIILLAVVGFLLFTLLLVFARKYRTLYSRNRSVSEFEK
jgi:hypothetical protein